jgi:glutamate-1-semialdehyde 2,1-aminomutase
LLSEIEAHPEYYTYLDTQTHQLAQGLRAICAEKGIAYQLNTIGSMISVHFTAEPVVSYESAKRQDVPAFNRFFHNMLQQGVYLPPSAYESWFLSTCHTPAIIDETLTAARRSL